MEFNPSYVGDRFDIISEIPEVTRNVLDLGCSDGTLGLAVKRKYNKSHVIGIEIDGNMGEVAKQRLDEVHIANLDDLNLCELFSEWQFDCIVMADVLEHLVDPWKVIRQASQLLSKNGIVITSIPNIRHISTITNLCIKGKWYYRSRGIHDIDHLRFFTRYNIIEMITNAGLKVIKEKRNMRITERGSRIDKYSGIFDKPIIRNFFTFQYIHVSIHDETFTLNR